MKNIFAVFLLFSLNSFAQKQEIFRIDSLPKQGILLEKGWKWHAGDNPDFAKADFDDSAWESIDPMQEFYKIDKVRSISGGWFRLPLYFEYSDTNANQLLVIDYLIGASEIYFNEKLIYKLGTVSGDSQKEKTCFLQKPVPLNIIVNKNIKNTLAIRYSFSKSNLYTDGLKGNPFSLTIKKIDYTNTSTNTPNTHDSINLAWLGVFFGFAFLHFVLYYFNPSQKANLIFGIFILFWFFHVFSLYQLDINTDWNSWFLFDYLDRFFFSGIYILMCLSVHSYLNESLSKLFLLIPLLFIGWVILLEVNFDISLKYLGAIVFITIVYYLYIVRKSYKNGSKKGQFLLIAGVVYISAIILSNGYNIIANFFELEPTISDFIPQTSKFMRQAAIPIGISLTLSRDFALANNSLKQKIIEIETLSIEKQQILSTQNETLEKQVKERTAELVASQNQLIQKEKLASLGELTAGIAHEIQNPLNFVNNFSELSVELIKEIQDERQKTREERDEALEDELLSDLSSNQEKINLHGKRASSIVKGMLEHSRASTGVKELTDINKLADEYLRLSYHGLIAKDKEFNADFKTDFDENLPKINVIPQDMGRVLLNIINNAFYAVSKNVAVETGHALSLPMQSQYQPTVIISTQKLDNQIIIKITDNGTGMPEATKAKIFQPFFTTKPTGQGTGLGLSLAYDIITKGHGGTIECESVEGEGTTFIVKLPIS